LLLAVVLASACVHYEPRPVSPADNAQRLASRTLNDPDLRRFLEANEQRAVTTWPLPAWSFAELSLAAFYYHPDLDVARAEWSVAQAGEVTAGERPNPTLSVVPGYNTTRAIPSPWLPLIVLDVPIETAGKRGHRLAEAAQLSEAARIRIASVAWQVRSRVRSGLVALYRAAETQKLLKQQEALQADNVRILEHQYDAGAISAFELTQARIAADATRLALRDAERQSATGRVQLAEAVGIPVGALDGAELSFDGLAATPPPGTIDNARAQALFGRSDILAALAEYEAVQAALQLEIAKQYPDIHLGPGYQYDQGVNKWSLGFTLALPVFNRNQGPIAEAEARRSEASARFNALQARVLAEVDRAVAAYRSAGQQQSDAEELHGHLQKQESRAQALLDAGEISRAELVALRLQLNAAELARLDAVAGALSALSALEDALQRPLSVPVTAWQTSPREPAAPPGGEQP
jgi:outer membrane protein TolC